MYIPQDKILTPQEIYKLLSIKENEFSNHVFNEIKKDTTFKIFTTQDRCGKSTVSCILALSIAACKSHSTPFIIVPEKNQVFESLKLLSGWAEKLNIFNSNYIEPAEVRLNNKSVINIDYCRHVKFNFRTRYDYIVDGLDRMGLEFASRLKNLKHYHKMIVFD